MEEQKTIQEMIQGINSLTKSVEWSKDKKQSVAYVIFDGENVTGNILGHCDCAASSITIAMVSDKDFRDVIIAAYHAYINYEANKLKPSLEPLIKYLDEVRKNGLGNQQNVSEVNDVCLFSEQFKSRHN